MIKKSSSVEFKFDEASKLPALDGRTMPMIRNAVVANAVLAALPGVLPPEYLCRQDGHRIIEDGDAYGCLTCGKRFTLIE